MPSIVLTREECQWLTDALLEVVESVSDEGPDSTNTWYLSDINEILRQCEQVGSEVEISVPPCDDLYGNRLVRDIEEVKYRNSVVEKLEQKS